MKILPVILFALFLTACSGQDGTKTGSGDSEVSNNVVGGDLTVIDNNVRAPGEGSSATIDQLNPVTTAPEPEEECDLSPETCEELEE